MKKIINFILTVLITILILFLILSYGIKDMVVNTISSSLVKNEVASEVTSTIKDVYPEVSYETLDDIERTIQNSTEIQEITEKYFESIIISVENNDEVILPQNKEELLNIINENEKLLEDNGIVITQEEKEEIINKVIDENLVQKTYEKISEEINSNIPEGTKIMVTTYNNVSSNEARIIVWIGIIISIIMIALLKKSFYKFTFNVAVSLFISGVFAALLIPSLSSVIASILSETFGRNIIIGVNNIVNCGYVLLALCALFTIIYLALDKMIFNTERKKDY